MDINKARVVYTRPINKSRYFTYGRLELPYSVRSYVDSGCSEYQELDDEGRLLDLAFVLLRGYNLKKEVKDWLNDHPYIAEKSIVTSIGMILLRFHDIDEAVVWDNIDSMDLPQMVDWFKATLLDCYAEEEGMQEFDSGGKASERIRASFGGHYLGEVHPNGKWQWTEYRPDKYDWRTIK